jgi:hypothetical protein
MQEINMIQKQTAAGTVKKMIINIVDVLLLSKVDRGVAWLQKFILTE